MKEKPADKQPVKPSPEPAKEIKPQAERLHLVFTANVHFGYKRDFKAGDLVDPKKLDKAEIAELKTKKLIEEK